MCREVVLSALPIRKWTGLHRAAVCPCVGGPARGRHCGTAAHKANVSPLSLFRARILCLFLWRFLYPMPHLHLLILCPSAFVFFSTNGLFFPPEAFSVFVLKMTSFLPLQAGPPEAERRCVWQSLISNSMSSTRFPVILCLIA